MSKPLPILGRIACQAMREATGLERLRSAEVTADYDDVIVFRVEFLATDEQARVFGEALARLAAPKPGP